MVARHLPDLFTTHRRGLGIRKVVLSPILGRMACQLLQCDTIRLWHDQVILKPGTNNSVSACEQAFPPIPELVLHIVVAWFYSRLKLLQEISVGIKITPFGVHRLLLE